MYLKKLWHLWKFRFCRGIEPPALGATLLSKVISPLLPPPRSCLLSGKKQLSPPIALDSPRQSFFTPKTAGPLPRHFFFMPQARHHPKMRSNRIWGLAGAYPRLLNFLQIIFLFCKYQKHSFRCTLLAIYLIGFPQETLFSFVNTPILDCLPLYSFFVIMGKKKSLTRTTIFFHKWTEY